MKSSLKLGSRILSIILCAVILLGYAFPNASAAENSFLDSGMNFESKAVYDSSAFSSGKVVTYPKPEDYFLPDGVADEENGKYSVRVNGKSVDIYPALTGADSAGDTTANASFGYFDMEGTVTVEITTDFDFQNVTVRPLSTGIKPVVDGRKVTFTVSGAENLSIEFDGDLDGNLDLFSNYIEPKIEQNPDYEDVEFHYVEPGNHNPKDILAKLDNGKKNVVYFKPGIHVFPSKETFYIPDNTTVYLAGGSVVYGRFHGQDAKNIKILGRGIVNGAKLSRRDDFGDGPESYLMRFLRCTDVEVNGIILQDSPHWTFVNIESEKVNVRNFKIVGQRNANNDGMDIVDCRDFTVDHAFVRTIDDAITVKAKYIGGERNKVSDITIQNTVLWNEKAGNALELGFETTTDQYDGVVFRNIDIIHNNSGGTMTIHNGDSAVMNNIIYDDIRVEGKTNAGSLVEMFIRDTYYSTGSDRGKIDGVTFNRIRYLPQDDRGSTFEGYDKTHNIQNVSFHDLVINGKQITSPAQGSMYCNQYTETPTFSAEPYQFTPKVGKLFEGEEMQVAATEGISQETVDSSFANGGKYKKISMEKPGDSVEAAFTVDRTGHYIPELNIRKGPDGGIYKIIVDGKDQGYWLDTYCADEIWQSYQLTDRYLEQGQHTVCFKAVSVNPKGEGCSLGLDYLNLTSPDDVTFEAENVKEGIPDGTSSAGYYAKIDSGETLTVPVSSDRISNLKLRIRTGPDLGTASLSVDDVQQGKAVNLYSKTSGFQEFDFGTIRMGKGEHAFKIKEASSSEIDLDYIKFNAYPKTILWRTGRLHFNNYFSSSSGVQTSVDGENFTTNQWVTSNYTNPNDWVNYIVTVPASGFYTVVARLKPGPDQGRFKVSANDVEYDGTEVDAYEESVGDREFDFGSVYLNKGENNLKLVATGKNNASTGIKLTSNYIKLIPGVLKSAAADTYTHNSNKDTNYSASQEIEVRAPDAGSGGERRAYLKFDLSHFGENAPGTAELRFTVKSSDRDSANPFPKEYRTIDVYPVAGSWDEKTITWNTAPDNGVLDSAKRITQVQIGETKDEQYAVDISGYLKENWTDLKQAGSVMFILANTVDTLVPGDQKNMVTLYSRESGTNGPQLWASEQPIFVKGLSLSTDKLTLWQSGPKKQLISAIKPANASAELVWKSANESVATVDDSGYVTPVGLGKTTVSVSTKDGFFSQAAEIDVVAKDDHYSKNLIPISDAYVWSDFKGNNYNTDELIVKALNNGGGGRKSYLSFNFSDYGGTTLNQVLLKLYIKSTDEPFNGPYRTVNLVDVTEPWEETKVTWNTAPAEGDVIATFRVENAVSKEYVIDITDYVNTHANRLNGILNLTLTNTTDGADQKNRITFYSKETTLENCRPCLSIAGEGVEVLPALNAEENYATTSIWTDGEVQTDDSLQIARKLGLAAVTFSDNQNNPIPATELSDATQRYDAGQSVQPQSDAGTVDVTFADTLEGSRAVGDLALTMKAQPKSSYQLVFSYSSKSNPGRFTPFYQTMVTNPQNTMMVYPYIRLAGFKGKIADVSHLRVSYSNADAATTVPLIFQEMDVNFTEDDARVNAEKLNEKQKLKMPTLFADDMILQRGKAIRVWGWGGKGNIHISLTAESQSTPASETIVHSTTGSWLAELPALDGGNTKYDLVVQDLADESNKLTFRNILIGDVYLASGQSNMAMHEEETSTYSADLAVANHENIRFFTQDASGACQPKDDIPTGKWSEAVGSNIGKYYAVAYQFAKEVYTKTGGTVPVAILSSAIPGTWIESWCDQDLLARVIGANPNKVFLNNFNINRRDTTSVQKESDFERRSNAPYNAMLHPLTNANIAGILWYQGENNYAVNGYGALFPEFINDLRKKFRDPENTMPFMFVQLPAYSGISDGYRWCDFRLMQHETTKKVNNAYMAVSIDCADSNTADIHPKNKTVVGKRLAAIALAKIYGHQIEYSGPEYESAERRDNKLILKFSHSDGLMAKNTANGELSGFEISSDGINFISQKATTGENNTVVITIEDTYPNYVRYGMKESSPMPMINLFNGANLPASPFTADVRNAEGETAVVSLSEKSLILCTSEKLLLHAKVMPEAENQKVTWSSDDEKIVTVGADGLITAINAGTATITATCSAGTSAKVGITVIPWEKYKKTVTPTADSYVWSDAANTNYVASTDLVVKPLYAKTGGGARKSYLAFDLSDYKGMKLKSAVLRLCMKSADSPFPYVGDYPNQDTGGIVNRTIDIYTSKPGWDSKLITWNNQPEQKDRITSFKVGPKLDEWYEIDLTDYLNQHRGELQGNLSLMLCNLTNMIDQKSKIAFYSSESGEKAPQLVLEGIDIYSAVDEVEVSTSEGVAPVLPASVKATLLTGVTTDAPVTWDPVEPEEYQTAGSVFYVYGHINGYSGVCRVKVMVALPSVQKDALQKLYDDNRSRGKGNYTDSSWSGFQKELQRALNTLTSMSVTQSDVDNQISALTKAIKNLKEKDDNSHSNSDVKPRPKPEPVTQTFRCDTTANFQINGGYQFKITSLNGQTPSFVIGTSGVFTYRLVKVDGNDYYFTITAIGQAGSKTGIYVNGVKIMTATAGIIAPTVKSDTTRPFNVKEGVPYVFKLTSSVKPTLVAGTSSAFRVEFVKSVGKDYFFKVTAVGKPGTSSGFYINSDKNPVTVAIVV